MSTNFAAMKGKLGSTDYFILAMKAGELAARAKIPSEMDEWHNLTMDEREQRDINYNRVKKDIAPYLAKDKDRFFGAIILTAKNFDPASFEPLSDIATKGLPRLYKTEAMSMGFLTFTGGEVLIPLDGQHRIKAIQFALDGKDENSKPIAGMSPSTTLANEDITVILVPYNSKKSRKIFTRVNRYAKPTSSGQNLMTDDEDYIAISARTTADWINHIDGAGKVDLVKTKGNSLGDREAFFTTLATIAECNREILRRYFPDPIAKPFIVEDSQERFLYNEKINEVWEFLTGNIEEFSAMLVDKTAAGDGKRREIRQDYLLGKPVPQACLFAAFVRLVASSNFTPEAAVARLNKIDWRKDAEIWDRLLISGNKILTKNAKIAVNIICYVAGGKFKDEEREELLASYQKIFPSKEQPDRLPNKV